MGKCCKSGRMRTSGLVNLILASRYNTTSYLDNIICIAIGFHAYVIGVWTWGGNALNGNFTISTFRKRWVCLICEFHIPKSNTIILVLGIIFWMDPIASKDSHQWLDDVATRTTVLQAMKSMHEHPGTQDSFPSVVALTSSHKSDKVCLSASWQHCFLFQYGEELLIVKSKQSTWIVGGTWKVAEEAVMSIRTNN